MISVVEKVATRQAWLIEPGRFEIRETTLSLEPGCVLIKMKACGLCSWELNHWKGLLGKCPQLLGHEIAGVIAGVGEGVPDTLSPGLPVTCFAGAGFADYTIAHYTNCFVLADNVPIEEALGEPLSCVITTTRAINPEPGDIGVVVGCGPMGLWCIQALAGNSIGALVAVDTNPAKLKLAQSFGATHLINPSLDNVSGILSDISGKHMADFVIEGTGIPDMLGRCFDFVRTGRGRIALMSSHEDVAHTIDWRPAISKGLQIFVTHPAFAIDSLDNLRRAVILLNNGSINSSKIITHRFSLDNIEEAFQILDNKPEDYIKGIVDLRL